MCKSQVAQIAATSWWACHSMYAPRGEETMMPHAQADDCWGASTCMGERVNDRRGVSHGHHDSCHHRQRSRCKPRAPEQMQEMPIMLIARQCLASWPAGSDRQLPSIAHVFWAIEKAAANLEQRGRHWGWREQVSATCFLIHDSLLGLPGFENALKAIKEMSASLEMPKVCKRYIPGMQAAQAERSAGCFYNV